ncbi:GIY-YIG nuclease family protein [Stappia sp. GBMRC 2046]|uniref:GIY-YIG nuclease family protein n=1 Tax=Stappia sediminis TaxID=2692190 RepID=A0A7X3S7T0_9HYPH|nr:GIY-YIG nuclease family protein [Stappia sediminis]MXN65116.1 GIY-YIG nuclease family protein [Stappia sediminis]
MAGWVYITASKRNGTLYVGVTSDLSRRIYEHRNHLIPGFTSRYSVDQLVWYECHATMTLAIQREKNIKHWPRRWKVDLIRAMNPEWVDLYESLA